jgi:hypothetical protein
MDPFIWYFQDKIKEYTIELIKLCSLLELHEFDETFIEKKGYSKLLIQNIFSKISVRIEVT